jgi:DNA-binding transcriptional LysR family regulator
LPDSCRKHFLLGGHINYATSVATFIQAGERALDLSNEPIGNIRVAACTSFGQKKLVPLLPIMRKKYPKLIIELVLTGYRQSIRYC